MSNTRDSLEYTYYNFVRSFQTQTTSILNINNNIHNALVEIMASPTFAVDTRTNQETTNRASNSDSELTSPPFPSTPTFRNINTSTATAPVRRQERAGSINSRRRRTVAHQRLPGQYRINLHELPSTPLRRPIQFMTTTPSDFLERVPVYPTVEQIENATTLLRFCDIANPINVHCPIRNEGFSNDDIVIRINQCQHLFYPTELHTWFRNNVNCPLCRCDIREVNTNTRYNNTHNNTELLDMSNNLGIRNENTDRGHSILNTDISGNTIPMNTIESVQGGNFLEEIINNLNNDPGNNLANSTGMGTEQYYLPLDTSGVDMNGNLSPIIEDMTQTLAQSILESFRDNPNMVDISGFEMSMSFITETLQ